MSRNKLRRILRNLETESSAPTVAVATGTDEIECDIKSYAKKKFVELAPLLLERKRKFPEACSGDQVSLDVRRLDSVNNKNDDAIATATVGIKIVQSIQELRNVYMYGLQKVSKLQDLQDAPDAILPGNFIAHCEPAATTTTTTAATV
jgi:hypothetical protein